MAPVSHVLVLFACLPVTGYRQTPRPEVLPIADAPVCSILCCRAQCADEVRLELQGAVPTADNLKHLKLVEAVAYEGQLLCVCWRWSSAFGPSRPAVGPEMRPLP